MIGPKLRDESNRPAAARLEACSSGVRAATRGDACDMIGPNAANVSWRPHLPCYRVRGGVEDRAS